MWLRRGQRVDAIYCLNRAHSWTPVAGGLKPRTFGAELRQHVGPTSSRYYSLAGPPAKSLSAARAPKKGAHKGGRSADTEQPTPEKNARGSRGKAAEVASTRKTEKARTNTKAEKKPAPEGEHAQTKERTMKRRRNSGKETTEKVATVVESSAEEGKAKDEPTARANDDARDSSEPCVGCSYNGREGQTQAWVAGDESGEQDAMAQRPVELSDEHIAAVARELGISDRQIKATLHLRLMQGNTVPFITRYRQVRQCSVTDNGVTV